MENSFSLASATVSPGNGKAAGRAEKSEDLPEAEEEWTDEDSVSLGISTAARRTAARNRMK